MQKTVATLMDTHARSDWLPPIGVAKLYLWGDRHWHEQTLPSWRNWNQSRKINSS